MIMMNHDVAENDCRKERKMLSLEEHVGIIAVVRPGKTNAQTIDKTTTQ